MAKRIHRALSRAEDLFIHALKKPVGSLCLSSALAMTATVGVYQAIPQTAPAPMSDATASDPAAVRALDAYLDKMVTDAAPLRTQAQSDRLPNGQPLPFKMPDDVRIPVTDAPSKDAQAIADAKAVQTLRLKTDLRYRAIAFHQNVLSNPRISEYDAYRLTVKFNTHVGNHLDKEDLLLSDADIADTIRFGTAASKPPTLKQVFAQRDECASAKREGKTESFKYIDTYFCAVRNAASEGVDAKRGAALNAVLAGGLGVFALGILTPTTFAAAHYRGNRKKKNRRDN